MSFKTRLYQAHNDKFAVGALDRQLKITGKNSEKT